jgi:hypothetical protein
MLDRIRTVVNVLGDSFGAAIVEHYSKNELKSSSEMTLPIGNGNSIAPFPVDINANGKGNDNVTFVEERM